MNYDDKDIHLRLLGVYERQIRSENGQRQWAYERLPWWRKLVTRRPKMLHGGYSAVFDVSHASQISDEKPHSD